MVVVVVVVTTARIISRVAVAVAVLQATQRSLRASAAWPSISGIWRRGPPMRAELSPMTAAMMMMMMMMMIDLGGAVR